MDAAGECLLYDEYRDHAYAMVYELKEDLHEKVY